MRKKCLVCGYEGFETLCPNCETLMMPSRRPMRKLFVEEVYAVPSQSSKICFGMWEVKRVRNREGKVFYICDCPHFVRSGSCKHINQIQNQEQRGENQEQREDDSSLTAEEILESILR
ncbi:MAG: hypothetical protein QXO33_05265 [Nitrososphaeria archaeon]